MNKTVKIYAEHLEDLALEQFNDAMDQHFVIRGALMPDAHAGYSLPIGAVVATDGVVVPSWVGYDIGCGMCAMPTSFDVNDIKEKSDEIFKAVYDYVPVGFHVNEENVVTHLNEMDLTERGQEVFELKKQFKSLGTLGGGNHFIEIGEGEDGRVWVIIHSGSRGMGHGMATAYLRLASPDGKVREGHYGLDVTSQDGKDYINDMNWCLEFALENRKVMMCRILQAITSVGVNPNGDITMEDLINRNHNHAEEKDGMWIHRKGATHADEGMMGVIPGNMRDGSFIVRGKGNPDSLYSSSHGAGRVMGRKQAKRELITSDFEDTMKGITAKVGDDTLDESPMAYKNIFEVMKLQEDLVEVVDYIRPIINIKG